MYPSMCKGFLLIVLAYLTLKCAGPKDENCETRECKAFVANCLNNIADFYKIELNQPIQELYNEDDLNFKKINKLQCAKNAIEFINFKQYQSRINGMIYMYLWKLDRNMDARIEIEQLETKKMENRYYVKLKDNLDPSRITPKSIFCGYKPPRDVKNLERAIVHPDNDENPQEAIDCMRQLALFPNDIEKALEEAFMNSCLSWYKYTEHSTNYMLHIIEVVKVKVDVARISNYLFNNFPCLLRRRILYSDYVF